MTRYRLKPLVSEWDGDDLWVAALPDGPITWVGGVGALVLEELAEPSVASRAGNPGILEVSEIVQALHAEFQELPSRVEETIVEFLESLERNGIVEGCDGISDVC